jgi:uncharacterized protein (TIGR02147 family)
LRAAQLSRISFSVIYQFEHPADFLNATFLKKSQENPKFSLRAFARKLGLSPGSLHSLLTKKKRLSVERSHEIAEKLQLTEKERDYFTLLVQKDSTKNPKLKASLIEKANLLNPVLKTGQRELLEADHYSVLENWYGFAILECLARVKPRGGSSHWKRHTLARALQLTTAEVNSSIDRFTRLGWVEELDSGSLHYKKTGILAKSEKAENAFHPFYLSSIQKMIGTIDSQSPVEKYIGAETIGFDPTQLPAVKKLADEFLDNVLKISRESKVNSELYQCFFSFHRLSVPISTTQKRSPKK